MKIMSLEKIYKIRDILQDVCDNVSHYEAMNKTDQYIVWAEDSEPDALNADNEKKIQVIQGTIDYFTKKDGDAIADDIQEALKKEKIPFYLNSVQYEEETGYIHHEWIWEVS